MRKRIPVWLLVSLFLALVLLTGQASASVNPTGLQPEQLPIPIKLTAVTITPSAQQQLAALSENPGYFIVQFRGPVEQAWKDQITDLGGELLDYLPDFAFKARLTPEQAAAASQLDSVNWVGVFQPAYKLSPSLHREGSNLYLVRLEQGSDVATAVSEIRGKGARLLRQNPNSLIIAADAALLETIANVLDVAWIENFQLRETDNEYGAGIILGSDIANAAGYDGSTQIIAVADTGLGNGTAAGAHPDIPASRIVNIYDWPAADSFCWQAVNDGAQDVDSGHGTHTSGSVLSDGGPGGEGKGTAPAGSLVFQAVEDYADMTTICENFLGYEDGYALIGLPDDIRDLFQQAYDAGARIHSNSWGSAVNGEYTEDAANTDDFMWNHPDMLVTTSAGNAGVDGNSNGAIDEDSMGSPATSKNILTVGASEHDRQGHYECDSSLTYTNDDGDSCNSQGGDNVIFAWGDAWPDDYPADPIASDPAAGNAEQMAAFSSRGPTDDGRIKPDVVAPGSFVLSNYADQYQEGYDGSPNPQNNAWQYDRWGFPLNQQYKYMGGTSMSNPLVAGAAAVVRDYYEKEHALNASAALVKATLINTAVDILDENNDGANDNDYPIPNNHEGWGLVDVAAATDGSLLFEEETTGLSTNDSATYQYNIETGGQPFKVSLVWSDYPGSTSASTALVNDLDLVVTAPNSDTYQGNVFSGGWTTTGGSADRLNNVENVYVQSAAAGSWTVEVIGYNIPNGPQPFALVVDGQFGPPGDTPPTVTITNPPNDTAVTGSITITADANDDIGVTQVEFFVDGSSIGVDSDGSDGWSTSWDTTTVSDGGHTITATATDTIGQTGNDTNDVTVDNTPPSVTITDPADGALVGGTVEIVADASDAATQVTQVEFFVDGGSIGVDSDGSNGWSTTWDTTTTSNGSHALTAVATDSAGNNTTSTAVNVTVDNGTVTTMHVGDLDGSGSWVWGNRLWQASVTITVHDANHNPVSDATVSGTWSNGASGSGECTTNSSGVCTISSGYIWRSNNSAEFTVDDATHASFVYEPASNHDPDGDSDGTSITIAKP
jgi:hypothetical protein